MKLVVAIDGSTSSFNALETVIRLGVIDNADVVIVSVISDLPTPSSVSEAYQLAARDSIRKEMEKLQQEVSEKLKNIAASVNTAIYEGHPGEAILDCADRENADLIVMGTKGKSGLLRPLIGSVASYVVSHSSVPVLVVPHC